MPRPTPSVRSPSRLQCAQEIAKAVLALYGSPQAPNTMPDIRSAGSLQIGAGWCSDGSVTLAVWPNGGGKIFQTWWFPPGHSQMPEGGIDRVATFKRGPWEAELCQLAEQVKCRGNNVVTLNPAARRSAK